MASLDHRVTPLREPRHEVRPPQACGLGAYLPVPTLRTPGTAGIQVLNCLAFVHSVAGLGVLGLKTASFIPQGLLLEIPPGTADGGVGEPWNLRLDPGLLSLKDSAVGSILCSVKFKSPFSS